MGNDFKKITILIIDSDNTFVNLIKKLINESFRSVCFVVDTLAKAQEVLVDQTIDLILIDPNITDNSVFKTIKKTSELSQGTPIIITSVKNNNIIADQAISLGIQDYLLKDKIDKASISKAIRFALKRGEVYKSLLATKKELNESDFKYLEAQKITRFGAWSLDIITNEMTWSEPMFDLLEQTYTTLPFTLQDYIKYVYISDKDMVLDYFKTASSGAETNELEHRLMVNGSEIKHVTLRAKMYAKSEGSGFVLKGTIQDVTDRKIKEQLYLEKSISKGKLNVQKKIMDELNFHIRTPLATLSNALHLMKNEGEPSQNLKILERSFDDLSIMITNLINYNLLQGDKITVVRKEIKTDNLIQSLKKIVYLKSQSTNIDVIIDSVGDLPESIEIDTQLVNQLITSLTSVFSKNQDKCNLEITFRFDKSLIVEFHSNQSISIETKDMSLESIENTLESFAMNEDFDSRDFDWYFGRFVLNHIDGQFEFSGNKNESTLSVNIPVENYITTSSKKQYSPDASIRLLLVEDHFLNQLTTKRLLSNWSKNVHVEVAMNGQEALDLMETEDYDIVLMDIHMPIMDGYVATTEIRKTSTVPIIGLSADSSNVEKKKCIELGMDAYLEKPYKPVQLYKVITNTLEWAYQEANG